MKWWNDAHFGMFIHWGVYSVFGNVYDGPNINGEQIHYDMRSTGMPSEWIMYAAPIPRAIYREAAKEFDAKDYDPKKWVETAKNAGMKYIVITAKHHDGFCLFKTQYTDWNVIDASPAKKDLLKDLVTESHKAGLKIGFYYSQNLDWMQEGGMGGVPELNGKEYSSEKVKQYVNNLVIPQITELTTNYDIDVFWFDFPGVSNSNVTISQKIQDALLNSPVGDKIIYNDRLFAGFAGDFATPETDTPEIPYNGYDNQRNWEACASINGYSWGFERNPEPETVYTLERWKSGFYVINRILELASKGGNFLLNVGPDSHGNISEKEMGVLAEVGDWMKIYGETVYGTRKNELLNPFEYGYVTQKMASDGSMHWYLHISPAYWGEKEVILNGVTDIPINATLFETHESVPVRLENGNLILQLPESYPNPYYSTIDLHFTKIPRQVAKSGIKNNEIRLTPFQATVNYMSKDYIPYTFNHWYKGYAEITYDIYLERGIYKVESEYAAWYEDGELYFTIDGVKYEGHYKNTGESQIPNDLNNYITDDLGGLEIKIPASKRCTIKISRAEFLDVTNWINVRSFTLKKQDNVPEDSIPGIKIDDPTQAIKIYNLIGRYIKTVIASEKTIQNVNLPFGIYIVKGETFHKKIFIGNNNYLGRLK
jgi:alpha-L-fucosidase